MSRPIVYFQHHDENVWHKPHEWPEPDGKSICGIEMKGAKWASVAANPRPICETCGKGETNED